MASPAASLPPAEGWKAKGDLYSYLLHLPLNIFCLLITFIPFGPPTSFSFPFALTFNLFLPGAYAFVVASRLNLKPWKKSPKRPVGKDQTPSALTP